MEASSALGRDTISWGQSETTRKTLREEVIVWQFARANNAILVSDYTALDTMDTENDLQLKKLVEDWEFCRMAKGHDFSEMWQGSQNICAT